MEDGMLALELKLSVESSLLRAEVHLPTEYPFLPLTIRINDFYNIPRALVDSLQHQIDSQARKWTLQKGKTGGERRP